MSGNLGKSRAEGSSDDEALEAQQWLLENSLRAAVAAYHEGLSQGLETPVVYVVDCEDEVGGRIVRSWLGDEAVDDAIAEQLLDRHDEDERTVFAWAFSWHEASRETPQMFPYLRAAFSRRPDDGFLAIAVTAGGASALGVPGEVLSSEDICGEEEDDE